MKEYFYTCYFCILLLQTAILMAAGTHKGLVTSPRPEIIENWPVTLFTEVRTTPHL